MDHPLNRINLELHVVVTTGYYSTVTVESAGLNALEELLFKMLGIEKIVMRAFFRKRDRKLAFDSRQIWTVLSS